MDLTGFLGLSLPMQAMRTLRTLQCVWAARTAKRGAQGGPGEGDGVALLCSPSLDVGPEALGFGTAATENESLQVATVENLLSSSVNDSNASLCIRVPSDDETFVRWVCK